MPSGAPASPTRKPRKDAVANRERILDHAEQVFTAEGFEVSLHRLADDLGIGIGTVYRHFPTHDELVHGIYRRISSRIDDAGAVFVSLDAGADQVEALIDAIVGLSVRIPIARAVAARVARRFPDRVAPSRWSAIVVEAVEQGKAAGSIRPDVQATDIAALAGMLADLLEMPEPQRSIMVPRMRALALDAIRPIGEERPPLPSTPLSLQDLTDIAHRQRTGAADE